MTDQPPPAWTAPSLSALPGIAHGFFGRAGGISTGAYAGLNAGYGSKDDPDAVAENRARIAAAFAQPPERLIGVHQIHSARAVRVETAWTGERPQADALVTSVPGLALSVLTADCTPVLFADPEANIIAAAHAGWRGACDGILEAAIDDMVDAGAERERIRAAIGPCIRQDSYQVGPEFRERFSVAEQRALFRPGPSDRFLFDLPRYCVSRLQRAGLNHIEDVGLDTYSAPAELFSHRRSVHEKLGDYGRNISVIMLLQL